MIAGIGYIAWCWFVSVRKGFPWNWQPWQRVGLSRKALEARTKAAKNNPGPFRESRYLPTEMVDSKSDYPIVLTVT